MALANRLEPFSDGNMPNITHTYTLNALVEKTETSISIPWKDVPEP